MKPLDPRTLRVIARRLADRVEAVRRLTPTQPTPRTYIAQNMVDELTREADAIVRARKTRRKP